MKINYYSFFASWKCPFSNEIYVFPSNMHTFISEINLPAEIILDNLIV